VLPLGLRQDRCKNLQNEPQRRILSSTLSSETKRNPAHWLIEDGEVAPERITLAKSYPSSDLTITRGFFLGHCRFKKALRIGYCILRYTFSYRLLSGKFFL
jgi:hypothetical protein